MPSSNRYSSRRKFLQGSLTASAAVTLAPALSAAREMPSGAASSVPDVKPFELEEITIAELQDGMKSGKFTASIRSTTISEVFLRTLAGKWAR
jgi:hypothetical protein